MFDYNTQGPIHTYVVVLLADYFQLLYIPFLGEKVRPSVIERWEEETRASVLVGRVLWHFLLEVSLMNYNMWWK